jgi:hypothetical protein
MSFDIIKHFTMSYIPKFNNKFNDNIEICNMLLTLSICINKLWGINDTKIFSLFFPYHGAFQNLNLTKTHGIPKKDMYIV